MSNHNAFDILDNERRRRVIGYLSLYDVGTDVDVRTIARVIASIEHVTPVAQIEHNEYESAYNSLSHAHLPKLDEHGLIAYNSDRKVVTTQSRLIDYNELRAQAEHSF